MKSAALNQSKVTTICPEHQNKGKPFTHDPNFINFFDI